MLVWELSKVKFELINWVGQLDSFLLRNNCLKIRQISSFLKFTSSSLIKHGIFFKFFITNFNWTVTKYCLKLFRRSFNSLQQYVLIFLIRWSVDELLKKKKFSMLFKLGKENRNARQYFRYGFWKKFHFFLNSLGNTLFLFSPETI